MKRSRRRYRVPANVLRQNIEGRIEGLQAELDHQKQEVALHKVELEEKALPALRVRHKELVAEWEQLPDDIRRHTRKPYLIDRGSAGSITTYRRATPLLKAQERWHWGRRREGRWYEDEWITFKDVYQFEHTRWGWDGTLQSRIWKLQQLLKKYEGGNGWILMTERELEGWGLSPDAFSWEM